MLKQMIDSQPKVSLFWLVLLRVMLGLLFITQWYSNLVNGLFTPEGLEGLFNYFYMASDNPLEWYRAFTQNVILPVAPFFTKFQLVAELLMGIALLVGFFTPLASVTAAFFVTNIFLSSWGADWPWSYLMILTICGILFFARAGRSMGVDRMLLNRFGDKFPLW